MGYHGGIVYAMKGNGTSEFWSYQCDSDRWAQKGDVPCGSGKTVKGGGAMVYATIPNALYVFKGNNTLDFFKYGLGAFGEPQASSFKHQAMGSVKPQATSFKLEVSPSIFRTPQSAIHISFTLPKPGNATLSLYDITGQLVTTLANGYHNAGASSFTLQAPGLPAGVYVLGLETDTYTLTQKLIIE